MCNRALGANVFSVSNTSRPGNLAWVYALNPALLGELGIAYDPSCTPLQGIEASTSCKVESCCKVSSMRLWIGDIFLQAFTIRSASWSFLAIIALRLSACVLYSSIFFTTSRDNSISSPVEKIASLLLFTLSDRSAQALRTPANAGFLNSVSSSAGCASPIPVGRENKGIPSLSTLSRICSVMISAGCSVCPIDSALATSPLKSSAFQ